MHVMEWDFELTYERIASEPIAHYLQVELKQLTADMQGVYEDGETCIVAMEASRFATTTTSPCLPIGWMSSLNSQPWIPNTEHADPILPTLQVS